MREPAPLSLGSCFLFYRRLQDGQVLFPTASSHASFPPQGPGTVANSEFPPRWLVQTVALPSPKQAGQKQDCTPAPHPPSLYREETCRSTQRRQAAGCRLSLCSLLLARCLFKAESSWECICGEALGLGFLAVGQFLMGTSYLWDLAQDQRSLREWQTTRPALLCQPCCFSQLLDPNWRFGSSAVISLAEPGLLPSFSPFEGTAT